MHIFFLLADMFNSPIVRLITTSRNRFSVHYTKIFNFIMDIRFSFEKKVIQLVVIGGVLLLSLAYIFSVEWLPTLRRKLQLQSEKYHYLKSLREKQEQQKNKVYMINLV